MNFSDKPFIPRSQLNTLLVNNLVRKGYAKYSGDELMFDWFAINANKDNLWRTVNFGAKSQAAVTQWLKDIEINYPELLKLPECPICKTFHLHNHGGLKA
jgi:hypothetical protein